MKTSDITILDGGLGRELARRGAPFRQPEWSALALTEAPDIVWDIHRDFIEAGAEVITTNSYAVVPFHIGSRFETEGLALAQTAARLAREAADASGKAVRVAASLPPLFGSYRPDLFQPDQAAAIARPLIDGQAPYADLWLAETVSSIAEARAWRELLPADGKPFWLAFTLADDEQAEPSLRSGETVTRAVRVAAELGVAAVLFNCSLPEVMLAAVKQAAAVLADRPEPLQIGVYANAFDPEDTDTAANEGLSAVRQDTTPAYYLTLAQSWCAAGASIVGGCCGIGPEHIRALAEALNGSNHQ